MKTLVAILLTIVSTSCATSQPEKANASINPSTEITLYKSDASGIDSIITNSALKSFKDEYLDAPSNKAFAQSQSGAWNWKSGRTSIEHAKTSALIGCQRNNKKSEDLYPCKVIHINDKWVSDGL